MNIVQALLNLLKKDPTGNNQEVPEGVCPNCWGRTEYGGKFYEAVKNEGIDANTASTKVGWVQDYADKHLAGIQLQDDGDKFICSKCKVSYVKA